MCKSRVFKHNIIDSIQVYATIIDRKEVCQIKVEVWLDFVCPFCYIGKRRFESALEKFPHKNNVTVKYKSYELDPYAEVQPTENYYELISNKIGVSIEEVKKNASDICEQATSAGLTYHFDTIKPTNTFDAHRLAIYAAKQDKGNEMTERILKAYFTDSEHIGDHRSLAQLAAEIGLNLDAVLDFLQTKKYTRAVKEDQEQAMQIGVKRVPFYVFNEKYGVSGAQPPEVFTEVLEKVWEEEEEQPSLQSLNNQQSETTYCIDEDCKRYKD